jgi:PAS domain S-box-containing protein
MKTGCLAFIYCEFMHPEVAAVARTLARPELAFFTFPSRCARVTLCWDDLAGLLPAPEAFDKIILLGNCCLDRLGPPPKGFESLSVSRLAHCFSLICGDYSITQYQQQGGYLVSSGWLDSWEKRLEDLGLDPETAPEFFGESAASIIHLDTGILGQAPARLEAFARFVRLPYRTVPVGLEFLTLKIESLIEVWRSEQKLVEQGRFAAAQKKCAEYAMALDLLKMIVQTTGKESVAREILQLYYMMFGASDLAYIPVLGDRAGPVTRIGAGSTVNDQILQDQALLLDTDYRVLPSGAGFLLRITLEGRTLGVVSIDGLAYPENLEQYLHIALETEIVSAVVLNNALNFEQMLAISGELRQSKAALRQSERLYHSMFEKSGAMQLLIDPRDGAIVDANPAAVEFYGYGAAELRDMKIGAINTLSYAKSQEELSAAVTGRCSHFLFQHRLATGVIRDVEVYSSPNQIGGRTLLHAIVHDITDRIHAEQAKLDLERRLQLAGKAQSLGRMAGAIAHRFNNLLGAVIGNLDLAMMSLAPSIQPAQNVTEALKAASRAAELSTLMLTYLGQAPGRREALDLSEVCRVSLATFRAGMPGAVQLVADLPSPGPMVSADEQQVQQMLVSLVTNAWESFGAGPGTVRLSVKTAASHDIHPAHRFPVDWQPQPEHRYSCIEVMDNGSGIAGHELTDLFDPFFSSKFTGRGLGLPIVLGIARGHGGGVTVESVLGRGSIFRVYLPQLAGTAPAQGDERAGARMIAGRGTVLLVEDEAAVRRITSAMLTLSGFTVLETKDGMEAIELFRERKESISFVISDLTMPRMDGWATLEALRQLAPGIPVILTSGYDQSHVMAGDHPQLPQAFLRKPFGMAGLLEAVRQALQPFNRPLQT